MPEGRYLSLMMIMDLLYYSFVFVFAGGMNGLVSWIIFIFVQIHQSINQNLYTYNKPPPKSNNLPKFL